MCTHYKPLFEDIPAGMGIGMPKRAHKAIFAIASKAYATLPSGVEFSTGSVPRQITDRLTSLQAPASHFIDACEHFAATAPARDTDLVLHGGPPGGHYNTYVVTAQTGGPNGNMD